MKVLEAIRNSGNFDLHKLYTYSTPETITDTGQYKIVEYVKEQLNVVLRFQWELDNGNTFWQWKTNRGVFTKRLASYIYKEHQKKITPEILTQIGNLYAENAFREEEDYYFVFTDKIDWSAGDFGDCDSCFWGGRRGAKAIIEKHGGLAMTFFGEECSQVGGSYLDNKALLQYDYGVARCFIHIDEANDALIAWNGYGYSTLSCARILACHLGLSYHKVELSNQGICNELVYINSGSGYILGESENIKIVHSADLDYFVPMRCYCCDDYVCDEDNSETLPDGCVICTSCYEQYYRTCGQCDRVIHRENFVTIHSGEELITNICYNCAQKAYTRCGHCYHYFDDASNMIAVRGYMYCKSCVALKVGTCQTCGKHEFLTHMYCDDSKNNREKKYCIECAEKTHNFCFTCLHYGKKELFATYKAIGYDNICEECIRREAKLYLSRSAIEWIKEREQNLAEEAEAASS